MKKTIQTRRNNKANSGFRALYAKTGRKRRLNAAAAAVDPQVDLESDVANVGIGKALIVILALHVFAIGAIYIHSKFFSDEAPERAVAKSSATGASTDEVVKKTPPATRPAVAASSEQSTANTDYSNKRYIVVTGDSYTRIAAVRNVDENALRALNSNRPLRAGVVLDLPDELSSRPVTMPSIEPEIEPTTSVVEHTPREREYARAIEVAEDTAPRAVVVKPKVKRSTVTTSLRDSGQRYTVKSGDTVWRIANRYKVSREDLLAINGLSDPRKLAVGRQIKIPVQ